MSLDSFMLESTSGGSRLLSEEGPSGHTGPGGDDLSLSELSLSNNTFKAGAGQDLDFEQDDLPRRQTGKSREERLQNDAFILKRLNAALASFYDALSDIESQNERVGAQLAQTEALLNKYVGIVSESEEYARLIFDEGWHGADADDALLAEERKAAKERRRQMEAERAAAAQRERERLELEERERKEREDRERAERERQERMTSTRGAVRGVRGTRASMRGLRGATATRGAPTARGSSSGSSISRGTSSTRGIRRT